MITGPKKLVKIANFFSKYFDIKPEVEFKWTDDVNFSECVEFDDGTFEISIQNWLTKEDLVRVIAHEMTHVWQYCRGDLKGLEEKEVYIWKGQMYKHTNSMEEYLLRPWEQEARAFEEICLYWWDNRKKRNELHGKTN